MSTVSTVSAVYSALLSSSLMVFFVKKNIFHRKLYSGYEITVAVDDHGFWEKAFHCSLFIVRLTWGSSGIWLDFDFFYFVALLLIVHCETYMYNDFAFYTLLLIIHVCLLLILYCLWFIV